MNEALDQPFRSLEFRDRKKSIEMVSVFGVRTESHLGSSKEQMGIQEGVMVNFSC